MQEIILQMRYFERDIVKSFKRVNFIFLSNCMSSVCHSNVIRMSLVYTRMSSVCHSYVLVCQPYVTRMYSCVIRMSLVCGFTMNQNCLVPSEFTCKPLEETFYNQNSHNSKNHLNYLVL